MLSDKLTMEAIDEICDWAKADRTIDTIKAIRRVWPLSLRDAKEFYDRYRRDITGLRQALLDMAGLKEGMTFVFDNSSLRIELKDARLLNGKGSFKETYGFLMDVLYKLYPNPPSDEVREVLNNPPSFLRTCLRT